MEVPNYMKSLYKVENKCHGGENSVLFSRVLGSSYFETAVDFIDHTLIPPNSSIGMHSHSNNEEIYFILKGTGQMIINNEVIRIIPGDIVRNKRFGTHSLINDSENLIEILVIQVSDTERR